jgi:hypothetical protein
VIEFGQLQVKVFGEVVCIPVAPWIDVTPEMIAEIRRRLENEAFERMGGPA